jgi:hypothetical protein
MTLVNKKLGMIIVFFKQELILVSICSNHAEYTGEENRDGNLAMRKDLAISNVLRFWTSFAMTILDS